MKPEWEYACGTADHIEMYWDFMRHKELCKRAVSDIEYKYVKTPAVGLFELYRSFD